ncbi:hypothetical protein R1sor_016466 [Riccia sorocarpa]|uniref:DDE-1 domain-containing protein n=1 Tax=Riccia sorocarpa TaxID=122646 RepID=A0ABD3HHV1_9MARC
MRIAHIRSRGVPDNASGVAYRTTKKSFMTSNCLMDYYKERRVSWADSGGATKIDNVSSHNLTEEVQAALDHIQTEIRFLPENSTHLTQPCDTFIISKIKDAWTRMWEHHKIQMILQNDWQGNGEFRTSGLLINPGKTFFLQLAAAAVHEVNQQLTKQIGLPGDSEQSFHNIGSNSMGSREGLDRPVATEVVDSQSRNCV